MWLNLKEKLHSWPWVKPLLFISLVGGMFFAFWHAADQYAEFWFPLYKLIIGLVDGKFAVALLEIRELKGESKIYLELKNPAPVVLYGTLIPENTAISSSTLVAHALQPVLMFTFIIIGGFFWSKQRLIPTLLAAFVGLILIETVNVPITLMGAVEDAVLYSLAPDQLDESLMIELSNMLTNGGRFALALAVGLFVIAFGRVQVPEESAVVVTDRSVSQ